MSKKMLINATHPEENRVAIVEDGILTELDIEIAGKEQTKGNIYKAVVVRVESGLQAAFVDYGGERLGFLQMGEIHPSLFPNRENKGRPRITEVLHRGQELLVQIVKEERGAKGAALTTFLSLPGRYMVLMPDSDTKGVSRKISDEGQRRKLKETMASLDLPENLGYIVRTAGIGQKKEELKRDFTYLSRLYESIQSLNQRVRPPALVYKESNLIIRSIRDYFSIDMDEVLVDDPKVFQEARDFFQQVMPEYARLVKLHQERRPIFARYQIEEQIETISKNKVPLPSGGSIVIDSTEALVAVDVNSGKLAGEQGVEATAYRTNLEAAAEVGRQLRLRDLGGLIVIDFIDMRERKHDRDVEKRLKQALKNDKARVTVGRISQFGLLEMSRQRIKAALAEGAYLSCPHCDGSGKVKSVEAQAVAFLRKVQAGIAKGQIGSVEGEIPLDVATYLLNTRREELHEMERQRNIEIFIKGRPDFVAGQAELTFQRRRTEKEKAADEVIEAGALPEPEPAEMSDEAQPGAPAAAASAESQESPAGEEGGKRKRRRRRRKKPTTEKAVMEAPESKEEAAREAPVAPEGEKRPAGETLTPATGEEGAPAAETPAAGETPQPAPRSRGRRRKKAEPAPAPSPEIEPAPPETAPTAKEPAPESEEKKPKRRTKPAQAEQPPPAGEAAGETAEEPTAAEPAAGEKPQRPARRRGRAKKAAAETTTVATPPEEGKAPPPPSPQPADTAIEPEKPKRRRSRRKTGAEEEKPAAKEAESIEPAATGEAASEAPMQAEQPSDRSTEKTAPAEADAAASPTTATERPPAEPAPETPAEVKAAEAPSKPARRGRPRKKTAAATKADAAASPTTAEKQPPAEPAPEKPTEAKAAEAPPKPARRGRPRGGKSAEPASAATAEKPETKKKAAPGETASREGTAEQSEDTAGKAGGTEAKKRASRKKTATGKKAKEDTASS